MDVGVCTVPCGLSLGPTLVHQVGSSFSRAGGDCPRTPVLCVPMVPIWATCSTSSKQSMAGNYPSRFQGWLPEKQRGQLSAKEVLSTHKQRRVRFRASLPMLWSRLGMGMREAGPNCAKVASRGQSLFGAKGIC